MVTPYDLRCQRVEKPLGIAGEPTFSWKLRSEQRGERQSAYRLQAASAPELLDTPDYMDSGWRTCQRGHDPLGNPEEGGADTYFYTFSGDGVEEWAPRYCYSGIGWLEILDYPGEISPEDVTFEAIFNQAGHISEMRASEPLFLQLHQMLIATIENNFHGVLTTCPPYEKGPADGDTSVTMPAFLWNLDCLPIVRRLDDDFAATVRFRVSYTEDDLAAGRVAPGMIRTVPEWSSMLVHNCRNLARFCGLLDETRRYLPELRRYFQNELAELHVSDYLVDSFFGGDWNSPDGNGSPEGGTLTGTCYEAFSLRTMAELLDMLERPDLAEDYRREAENCRASIEEKLRVGAEYRTAKAAYFPQWGPPPWGGPDKEALPVGFRQTSSVLPLALDLTPEGARSAVAQKLVEELHKNGDHLDTGFVGAKYLLTTLSDLGYVDLAYTIATQRDYPSWGYWVEQGATTCWEHWGRWSRSYDHFFLAAGLEDWFRETLAGIRDVEDGFGRFTIRPQIPQKLRYFAMASETVRGRVSSAWEKTGDGFRLTVEIPVGAQAEVLLPPEQGTHVTLDGAMQTTTRFTLGSGTYEFVQTREAN